MRLFRDETQAEAYALATAEPVAPVGAVATISLVPGACLLWGCVEREVLNAESARSRSAILATLTRLSS